MGESIFAVYLSHLEQWGDVQDRRLFDQMWDGLRAILRRELSRRDLWRHSPGFLGLYGSDRWDDQTLDDLTQDCYLFVIHERRRALVAQLRNRHDIHGLIVRNVRSYLFETQRRHDPLGFRVYEQLQLAARNLARDGELDIVRGDSRVRNDTIMEFTTLEPSFEPIASASPAALADVGARWCDQLLPDLVAARGHAVRGLQQRLQACFRELPDQDAPRFRFGDLVDAVKGEARRRWTAVGGQELAETNPLAHGGADDPVHQQIEWERYGELLQYLESAVDAFPGRRRTRQYLRRLLTYLCNHAAQAEAPGRLPSSRRLAETLGIPRDRLAGLFDTLRGFAEQRRYTDVPIWTPIPSPSPVQERASP